LSETVATSSVETSIGTLRLAATPRGLARVAFSLGAACEFHGWLARVLPGAEHCARLPALEDAERQLAEYFAGKRHEFQLPLDLRGSDFQLAVWHALAAIPFGETRTYGEVARAVGRPGAARAVGAASGANPVAVIVPCHRVTAARGKIGGYGGGLRAKRILLGLERSQIFA
jgi:methylated-DNA-[protein]-cysteine S-methyltransferase